MRWGWKARGRGDVEEAGASSGVWDGVQIVGWLVLGLWFSTLAVNGALLGAWRRRWL